MKKNMGNFDKAVRLLVALVVVVLAFTLVLVILAAVFVLTSLIGFCPLYWPFGINTGSKKK
jgi:hypothetical protein